MYQGQLQENQSYADGVRCSKGFVIRRWYRLCQRLSRISIPNCCLIESWNQHSAFYLSMFMTDQAFPQANPLHPAASFCSWTASLLEQGRSDENHYCQSIERGFPVLKIFNRPITGQESQDFRIRHSFHGIKVDWTRKWSTNDCRTLDAQEAAHFLAIGRGPELTPVGREWLRTEHEEPADNFEVKGQSNSDQPLWIPSQRSLSSASQSWNARSCEGDTETSIFRS